jgi:pimeloyl-ACP methyl ester carboxylesterase
MAIPVIALPGSVMPAAVRYAPLVSALGDEGQFQTKDLEVYAGEEPPAGYSIELEVEALARFADSLQLDRFHLLGYSGGGFVSLAFAGAYPDRLLSLAVRAGAGSPES